MATIDQIRALRMQGVNDSQIVNELQQQGISPREINEAMSQANIKDAISNPINEPYENYGEGFENVEGMEPSMLSQQIPQTQEGFEPMPQQGPHAREIGEQVPTPGSNFQPDYEGGYGESYQQYARNDYDQSHQDYASQDIMTEIASQMITEKTKPMAKKISELGEIGILLTSKVEKMDQRLSRVESIIDQLQTSLLRKANDQEQNIYDIKNEMGSMQESFSKIINPLVDATRKSPLKRKKTFSKKTKKK